MNDQTATPDTPAYFLTLDEIGLFVDDLPDTPDFKEMYETEEQSYAALIRGGRDIRAEGAQSAIIFRQPPIYSGQRIRAALIFYSTAATPETAEALYFTPDSYSAERAAATIKAAYKGWSRAGYSAGYYNGVRVEPVEPETMAGMLEVYQHRLILRRYRQFEEEQFIEGVEA